MVLAHALTSPLARLRRASIVLAVAAFFAGSPASANKGGIYGYSGNPATNAGLSCDQCHSGGVAPAVSLSGPTQVDGGETETYTLTISGGQQSGCGLDVGASLGSLLAVDADTREWNDDITHDLPRAVLPDGTCTFTFEWTAPLATGQATIYAAGNSVDLDDTTAGDLPGLDDLVIDVDGFDPGEIPPTADAGGPYTTVLGTAVAFDGTGSSDPDGTIVDYEWDFGDGNSGTGATPSHTYASNGDFDVTLTVTDDDDFEGEATTTVRVRAQPSALGAKRIALDPKLRRATLVTAPPGDPRLFVIQQIGGGKSSIFVFKDGAFLTTPFLAVSDIHNQGEERGMRGLAFAPDYATSGLFYILYTNTARDLVLQRVQVSANPDVADATTRELLLTVPNPVGSANVHFGSHIAFGDDGMLYLATGDAGVATTAPDGTLLNGKMLRLDVSGGLGSGYSVPGDNPFVGPGPPLDEIWSSGFRNPYRFDIDPLTGDFYVTDVGGGTWEEVNVERSDDFGGLFYGWPQMEGDWCRIGPCVGAFTIPIYQYGHADGHCAIIGGAVYRGSDPSLQGRFFFSDWCTSRVYSVLWDRDTGFGGVVEHTSELAPDVGDLQGIAHIGRGGFGELYLLDQADGELFKIVSPQFACLDGEDNDGDGAADYPRDPGCAAGPASTEAPECNDGIDNDGDGGVDFDGGGTGTPDATCQGQGWRRESTARRCGLGFEVGAALGLVGWLRLWRRRR